MKKNIKNEKVIRAITIGLATMIAATSTPMTVFADEADPTEGGSDDNNYSSTEDTASETSDEAIGSTADAATSAEVVANDVNTNVTPKDVEVTEDGIIVDKSQVVIDAAGTVANDPQYVDAAGALTTVPVYDKKGNLINGIKTEDESTMVDDIKAAQKELLSFDVCMTTIESMMESGKVDTNASGYDLAFKANLEAFKAAVYTYGYDYVQGLNADEVNAMEDEAAKAILLNLIGTRDEITKYAIKDDWNAKKVVAPALEDIKDEKGEKAAADDMDKAVEDGQAIAEAAFGEQKKADDAAGEATELVNETEEKFNGYVEDIEKAKTISAAKNAYNELLDLLGNAETTLAEKQAAYDAAYKAFYGYKQVDPETEEETEVKGLKALYEEKQAALTAAKAAYKAASEEYEKAKSTYNDLDGKHTTKINDLTTYHAALEAAKESLAQAEADLANAKAKADALVDAATAAKEAVIADKAAMLDVVKKIEITEEKVKEDGKTSWNDEDALCLSIIKNYYIPSIAEGELTDIKCETIKGNKTVDNNTYNYIKVTYKVDGAEVVKYLNYKLEKGSKSSIYIFEKRENEIAANDAYMNDADATLYKEFDELNKGKDDKDKVSVDGYTAGDDKLTEDELQAALTLGTVVQIDGVYYRLGTGIEDTAITYEEDGKISDVVDGDTRTIKTIDTESVEGVKAVDAEGKVVETFTGDVTTLVYHKKLDETGAVTDKNGYYQYEDKEAAKAAAAEAKAAKSGEGILSTEDEAQIVSETHEVEYTDKENQPIDTYTVEGSYVPVFKQIINIDSKEEAWDWLHNSLIGEGKAIEKAYENNSTINNIKSNYYILSDTGTNNLSAKHLEDHVGADDYQVTGSVTLRFVEKDAVNESSYTSSDTYSKSTAENEAKNALDAYINELKSQGKLIVDSGWDTEYASGVFSWKYTFSYYVKYVDMVTSVSGETKDTEAEAKESFLDTINKLKGSGAVIDEDHINATTTKGSRDNYVDVKKKKEVTTYGYTFNFWEKSDEESTEDAKETVKTVNYDSDKIFGYVTQNANEKEHVFDQSDKEFQKLVKETSDLRDKYTRIEEEAMDAQAAVKEAQEQVETLRKILYLDKEGKDKSGYIKVKTPNGLKVLDIVKDLGINPEDYTLEDLDEKLSIFFSDYPDYEFLGSAEEEFEKAKEELEEAKEKLQELIDQKDEVEKKLKKKIAELTPDDNDDEEDIIPGGTVTPFIIPEGGPATLIASLPTSGVAGVRASRAGHAGDDGELIETTGVAKQPVVKQEEKKVKEDNKKVATTKIEDNKTPLAAAPEEEQAHMSWWWLLLVALFGAGAYEAYKKHQEKKAEAASVSESINKEEN